MKQLTLYKILSIVLLPFAVLFGFSTLVALLVSLANPAILLPVFIMACFVIYTVSSMIFLQKGITKMQPCKASLKDWIKVNGYVCIFLGSMMFINSISLLASKKADIKLIADQMVASEMMQQQHITTGMVLNMIETLSYVLMVFAAVLMLHVYMSFRYLKKYEHVFSIGKQ